MRRFVKHTCHAFGCTRRIPARLFACGPHWFSLPKKIRDAVWREYMPRQEVHKDPSARYMAVQQLAIAHTAFRPNDEEAARISAEYAARAFVWAERAKADGLGDPLEGLVGP